MQFAKLAAGESCVVVALTENYSTSKSLKAEKITDFEFVALLWQMSDIYS